jgi:hypothetical protein
MAANTLSGINSDVLGIRVPATLLESGYFWAFLIVAAVTVLGVAYFKYGKRSG